MNTRQGITLILGILGIGMMGAIFLNESSPYVTILEGKKLTGEGLHLAGEILPGSIKNLIKEKKTVFEIQDQLGDRICVHYKGLPPANFLEVKKVVAIGQFQQDYFSAEKLLLKCPSKYESK